MCVQLDLTFGFEHSCENKMRKYYQAALAVTAVISLISLLFYRHEYNRLRYVLEVFNYFGKPQEKAPSKCSNGGYSLDSMYDRVKLEFPISSWQRINDDLYVYSAYRVYEGEIRAIALSKFTNSPEKLGCSLYFMDNFVPHIGSFRRILIDLASLNISHSVNNRKAAPQYIGLQLICSYNNVNKTVVGVSFFDKMNKIDPPVVSVKNLGNTFQRNNKTVMCIVPPSAINRQTISFSDMYEFLLMQRLNDIHDFVVYDYFGTRQIHMFRNTDEFRLLEEAGINLDFFSYSVVAWNIPFTNVDDTLVRALVETECSYRAYAKTTSTVTVSWNEYIVLTYHRSLTKLITDLEQSDVIADHYKLETRTFCFQQPDDIRCKSNNSSLMFRKTKFDQRLDGDRPIYIRKIHQISRNQNFRTRTVGRNLGSVYRYCVCSAYNANETYIYDPLIEKLCKSLKESGIFKYKSQIKSMYDL